MLVNDKSKTEKIYKKNQLGFAYLEKNYANSITNWCLPFCSIQLKPRMNRFIPMVKFY